MKLLTVLSILLFYFTNCFAQRILTLEESISIALHQSYAIKSANYSLISSERNLQAVKLGLRTNVNMELDIPSYSRSLTSEFNTATGSEQFYQVGNTTFESRLFINQPIVFTNGQFSLVGSLFGREQSGLFGKNKDYFSNLSIRLNQPLFAYNTLKANLDRAELNLQKTQKNYTRAQAEIIYNVTSGFYNLYQSKKNLEITQEKVKQVEESYNTAVNKFKAGLIAEVEELQLQVDLASSKNELLSAERRFEEARNNFKLLIGLPLNEDIDVSPQLEYDPITIDKETAVEYALKNRPDLHNSATDIKLSEMSIEETDAQNNIKGELNVNYGINKVDDKFNRVFRDFLDNRSITFTVSLPVWDWGKNSREVESAEANLRLSVISNENLEESIKNEVYQVVNKLESAKSRVEVLSKTVEVAQKSYDISIQRFKVGNITSFELFQMQNRLTDAKINSLNALIDYKLSLADLYRKTLYEFKH